MEELRAYAMVVAFWGAIFDLCIKKIPNWITFTAIILGLAMNFFFFRWAGVSQAALGIGIGFLIYIPMYVFKIMGGGDVKLLMAIGAFAGPKFCLSVGIAAIFVGGAFALIETLSVGRLVPVIKTTVHFVRSVFIRVLEVEPLKLDEQRKFSFGVALALATVIVIWMG